MFSRALRKCIKISISILVLIGGGFTLGSVCWSLGARLEQWGRNKPLPKKKIFFSGEFLAPEFFFEDGFGRIFGIRNFFRKNFRIKKFFLQEFFGSQNLFLRIFGFRYFFTKKKPVSKWFENCKNRDFD